MAAGTVLRGFLASPTREEAQGQSRSRAKRERERTSDTDELRTHEGEKGDDEARPDTGKDSNLALVDVVREGLVTPVAEADASLRSSSEVDDDTEQDETGEGDDLWGERETVSRGARGEAWERGGEESRGERVEKEGQKRKRGKRERRRQRRRLCLFPHERPTLMRLIQNSISPKTRTPTMLRRTEEERR